MELLLDFSISKLADFSNEELEEMDNFIMSLPYDGGIFYVVEFWHIHNEFKKRNYYPKRIRDSFGTLFEPI